MLILSTMFESILRIDEKSSSKVLCELSENYFKKLYPTLDYNNLGKNIALSTHQLASSIFFIVLMKKCFKGSIPEYEIELLGKGVSYHYKDDQTLNIENLTLTNITDNNNNNNLKFFIYYVIIVCGHYLDHCRGPYSDMINEPYIKKLFNLFDIKEKDRIELVKLVVNTLRITEFKRYDGKIKNINKSSQMIKKNGYCSQLRGRKYNPLYKTLSLDFEKCYTTLTLN